MSEEKTFKKHVINILVGTEHLADGIAYILQDDDDLDMEYDDCVAMINKNMGDYIDITLAVFVDPKMKKITAIYSGEGL